MVRKWDDDTLIKCVFLYIQIPAVLGRCKLVCKKWRDILTKDDYMGRCLCARLWPSLSRVQSRDMMPLFTHIYRTFSDALTFKHIIRKFIPKSSINDYKFYLDIWNGDDGSLILSKVISASSLSRNRHYSIPSPGIFDPLVRVHLESSDYKLIAPIEPRLTVPRLKSVNVSLIVARGNHETACIIHKSTTHVVLPHSSFAVTFNDLDFCRSTNIFVPHIRAWLCMYFMDADINEEDDSVDVFGIELGFSDVPAYKEIRPPSKKFLTDGLSDSWFTLAKALVLTLKENVFLCLLEALDWKRYSQKISAEPTYLALKKRKYYDEILDVVFPLLEGADLAKCMLVCKQWRDMGADEYFWKCACAKGWPSVYEELLYQNDISYYQLFGKYWLRPPRFGRSLELASSILDIGDVEMYLDIRVGSCLSGRLVYSKVVSGASLLAGGIDVVDLGVCDGIKSHLNSSEFKMTIPIEPRFSALLKRYITVNLLVRRKDINKVACLFGPYMIIDYCNQNECRIFASDYPELCANYPFAPKLLVCFSLLCMSKEESDWTNQTEVDVFGAELDFYEGGEVFNSKEQILWLLHMLDWK